MAEHTGEICTGLAGQSGAAQAQNSGNCTRLRLVAMASNAHRCPGMPLDEALWLWTWLWCCGECGWSCGCGCGCGCRCQGSLGRIKPFCASIMLFLLRLVGDRSATPPSRPSTPPLSSYLPDPSAGCAQRLPQRELLSAAKKHPRQPRQHFWRLFL